MAKILVVDDHAIMRKGVIRTLEEAEDLEVNCDEAANATEALAMIDRNHYQMALLDISMPGMNGLDLLKQLHQNHPDLPVLLLSMHPEEQYAIRALTLGAVGYLTKESAADELTLAVKKVLFGGRYISSSLGDKMAAFIGSGRRGYHLPHETLSDRELQIFRMIGTGKSPSQMADDLCISIKTISTYRTRIMQKMQMKTNAEIIAYAIKHSLIT